MTKTQEASIGEISYAYDAAGRRILKSKLDSSSNKTAIHYPTDSYNIAYNPDGTKKISKHITLAGFPIVTPH